MTTKVPTDLVVVPVSFDDGLKNSCLRFLNVHIQLTIKTVQQKYSNKNASNVVTIEFMFTNGN
tara:strand:- start:1637 stop:1825 length:189 start_codon:yes stop_codon:yes gene_type:complete